MLAFYPHDISIWREEFDFAPDITLTPKEKIDHKVFYNRWHLFDFLKEHGVRLDDPQHPLLIESAKDGIYPNRYHHQGELFIVTQRIILGWIKDDYV